MLGFKNAIIGAGGIGSYFCAHLHKALYSLQFGVNITHESFTVFDPKYADNGNFLHQDFIREYELSHNKSAIMAARYGFSNSPKRFVESDLTHYNSFIICADNKAVRKMIYDHCVDYSKQFIDLRCQADAYAFYTEKVPVGELMDSLGKTEEERKSTTGFSCMTNQDKEANRLQLGNAAVAVAGVQLLLARYRGEPYPYKKELVMVV